MLINWFTVFAQIFNFLILVGLLRWFLYKPILNVMKKRQLELEKQWFDAKQLQTEATQERILYEQQQQQLQAKQGELMAEARALADQERQQQLLQIRQEIADQRSQWQVDLQQEQTAFFQILRQNVIHQTAAIARQALEDLANADLEQQIIRVFCERLAQLKHPEKQAIAQALAETKTAIIVRSSFALSPDLQQKVIETLHAQFKISQAIEFITVTNLLYGIEIKLAGQEIVWSLDHYLETLEQRLATALTQGGESHDEVHIRATPISS